MNRRPSPPAALNPEVGNDVVAAMKKEIHRMENRLAELMRRQEKLIQEMEKSIYKRELITTKSQVGAAQGKGAVKGGAAAAKKQVGPPQREDRPDTPDTLNLKP